MTLTEMIERVASDLGSRSGITDRIVKEIQFAQVKLEASEQLPWFLINYLDTSWLANDNEYALPATLIRGIEDIPLFWRKDPTATDPNKMVPLASGPYAALASDPDLSVAGTPEWYAIQGSNYYIWPIPDIAYNARLIGYIKAATLTLSAETNLWSTHCPDLLIAEAGYKLGKALRDQPATQLFNNDRGEAAKRLWASDTAHRSSGFIMKMAG